MKIRREMLPTQPFEELAEAHDLTLVVEERTPRETLKYGLPRFYCHFDGAEVKEGGALIGEAGNGDTEAQAIRAYAGLLSGTTLVRNAMSQLFRREIAVPKLTFPTPSNVTQLPQPKK